jgi:glycosyltransferase involved in cell wall biosynthesis
VRILKIADIPQATPGGMLSFMRRSGGVLEESGHRVDYLFREDLFPGLRGGRRRRLLVPWLIPLAVLRRERLRGRYDIVEIHEQVAAPYCILRRGLGRGRLVPSVVASYGTEELYSREQERHWKLSGSLRRWRRGLWVRFLIRSSRTAFRHADHVMVPSDADARYLREELGIPGERLTRVDSGVGDEFFEVTREEATGTGPRVVFAGTWIDRKGAPDLVEAWRRVAASHPTASLSVTCTVIDERTVLSAFDGGAERVSVTPLLSDDELRAVLATHDLFVLPSWFEGGISLASLQAAAAGLPCIVTAIGGNEDLFRPAAPHDDGALLVPPHDPEALAAAITLLLEDPSLRQRLGHSARTRARSFTWRMTAARSLEAYSAALTAAKRRDR